MKIAIASDDQKIIAQHIGRSNGFVIFEIEDNKIKNKEYRLNTFTRHAQGQCQIEKGANHNFDQHSHLLEALSDCQVIISQGMGYRIQKDLVSNNIQPLVTSQKDVEKALGLYLEGKIIDESDNLYCSGHK
jgi:predicted Fe-Mo cluster-binding NifX family protein